MLVTIVPFWKMYVKIITEAANYRKRRAFLMSIIKLIYIIIAKLVVMHY